MTLGLSKTGIDLNGVAKGEHFESSKGARKKGCPIQTREIQRPVLMQSTMRVTQFSSGPFLRMARHRRRGTIPFTDKKQQKHTHMEPRSAPGSLERRTTNPAAKKRGDPRGRVSRMIFAL